MSSPMHQGKTNYNETAVPEVCTLIGDNNHNASIEEGKNGNANRDASGPTDAQISIRTNEDECPGITAHHPSSDGTNLSTASSRRNPALSKRFQQIWFAVKRFSPIHRPKETNNSHQHSDSVDDAFPNRTKERKHSIGCEAEHLVGEISGPAKLSSWSPFARRRHNKQNKQNKQLYRLYSSHPDISSNHLNQHEYLQEDALVKMMDESSAADPTANTGNPTSHTTSSRSPLNRIRKIKRDMQRCVQRATTTNEYELNRNGQQQPGGQPNRRAENNNQEEEIQLVAATKSNTDQNAVPTLNSTNTNNEKRYRFQKNDTVDRASVDNLAGDEFEEEILQIHPQGNNNNNNRLNQGDISFDKVQNYETFLQRQKISKLLQFPFYQVDIHLRYAQNLLAKDSNGTSDPYVKLKVGNQIIHKSRTIFKTLNPNWDEYLVVPVEDIFEPIVLKVYDHDLFRDDYLGTAHIDLTKLEPGVSTELELFLHEVDDSDKLNVDESWGKVCLSLKLNPKTQEEKEHFYGRGKWITSYGADGPCKKVRTQPYDSVVNVLLIKGSNISLDLDYCIKFKLAVEKYKSKVVSRSVQSPYWAEQFDLHLYADQSKVLEITLCGANQSASDFIEKTCIDLSELSSEKSHKIIQKFPTEPRCIELIVTITGSQHGSANIAGNNFACSMTKSRTYADICRRYDTLHSLHNLSDIGHLIIKVYKAESLVAADINGKSDPFCVLELVNERLRTGTEYKTLSPEWNKMFTLNIKDIHEVLEVTVYDEDKDRVEFLGKVSIPLLKIKNGEKKWYALKDKKLRNRVKGHILLEFWISFNHFKASVRTFTPREKKYIQPEIKFKRALFVRNAIRLKNVCMELVEWGKFMNSCIQWESPLRSLVAFIFFLAFVYFFELYMIPLLLLLVLLKNYIRLRIEAYFHPNSKEEEIEFIDENEFDEDDEDKGEEKKSLKEKLQTVQEISTVVMNIIGEIASFSERIKNTSNFSVPFLSWLAVICLTLFTLVLYNIPIRYLILAWGINKFTKKFRAPHAINNNELLDFLSRVPDIEQKITYKEFKPNVQERKASQQSPNHGGIQSHQSIATGSGPISTSRKSSLSKNTSFKSEQSNTSAESDKKAKKKK